MSASLQSKKSPTYISTSTSEMTPGVCSDSWKVLVGVILKSCQEEFALARALETECNLKLEWVSIRLPSRASITMRVQRI